MSIYTWITLMLMLLVVVIANSDEHPKMQMALATIIYFALVGLTVMWIVGC